jgi:hypothetical protein
MSQPTKVTMTPEIAAQLREPFKDNEIGKLPKVTCGACRQSPSKNCQQHSKQKCMGCGNWMTSAHIHIDYVGHAEETDRFLQVDPEWNWEPMALNHDGIPHLDNNGGLWIRLTIAGITRPGYGHADGKKGGDAIKEAIGDALRNAGMRFGVAIDLWGAKFEAETAAALAAASEYEDPVPDDDRDTNHIPAPAEQAPMVDQKQHRTMHALWRELEYDGEHNRDLRLSITAKLLGLSKLESSAELTQEQAGRVIAALRKRLDDLRARQAARQAEQDAEGQT